MAALRPRRLPAELPLLRVDLAATHHEQAGSPASLAPGLCVRAPARNAEHPWRIFVLEKVGLRTQSLICPVASSSYVMPACPLAFDDRGAVASSTRAGSGSRLDTLSHQFCAQASANGRPPYMASAKPRSCRWASRTIRTTHEAARLQTPYNAAGLSIPFGMRTFCKDGVKLCAGLGIRSRFAAPAPRRPRRSIVAKDFAAYLRPAGSRASPQALPTRPTASVLRQRHGTRRPQV